MTALELTMLILGCILIGVAVLITAIFNIYENIKCKKNRKNKIDKES